jgi:hypothetical protein
MDRWRAYEIKEDPSLGQENEIFKNPGKRKDSLRQQSNQKQERAEAKNL